MSANTASPQTQPEQWKQKYRDSVRDFDAKETAWRESETRLHKSLLRVSFAFIGLDKGLDSELKAVQAALKKNPDAAAREGLIDRSVQHVTAFMNSKAFGRSTIDPCEPLLKLLGKLKLPKSYTTEAELLSARIAEPESTKLLENADRAADMINGALTSLASEPAEDNDDTFQQFLDRVNIAGSVGEKVTALQARSAKIKTEIDRLLVIDDTINLLTEELDQDAVQSRKIAQARALIRELIEWMTLPSQVEEELKGIQSALSEPSADLNLSNILRDLGHTVSQFHSNLMAELSSVEVYLKNIAVRLKELQIGIDASFRDQNESQGEQETLNRAIAERVTTISETLANEEDLDAIKSYINEGLHDIGSRMREHMTRSQKRLVVGEERLKGLSARLKKMDEESTRLRSQVRHERERAQQDALTGISNRAAYDERIKAEESRYLRHGGNLSLAVIDIDKFKSVNDQLGHKAGDKVLKSVAEICAANVRASDFIARFGGEEFALILPETPLDSALAVAEKLRLEIASKGFYYDSKRVPISVSIGIAEFSAEESADDVFKRADAAMYAAKNAGRNQCKIDTISESLERSTTG